MFQGGGHGRILIAFLLILIPSMLWLELTRIHIQNGSSLTQYRYRKPLACGIRECPIDSLFGGARGAGVPAVRTYYLCLGPYARDSSDSERWDSLGMEISLVIHGKNGSPHSGHGKPGRTRPAYAHN